MLFALYSLDILAEKWLRPFAQLFFLQIRVSITEGSHNTEEAINRQLADKERVAAAMENTNLMHAVNQCLALPE